MVLRQELSSVSEAHANISKLKNWTRIRHLEKPDFHRPLLEIPPQDYKKIFSRLCFLYGESEAKNCLIELERILKVYYAYKPLERIEAEPEVGDIHRFTEEDVILITYGDLLFSEKESPLARCNRDNSCIPFLNLVYFTLFDHRCCKCSSC